MEPLRGDEAAEEESEEPAVSLKKIKEKKKSRFYGKTLLKSGLKIERQDGGLKGRRDVGVWPKWTEDAALLNSAGPCPKGQPETWSCHCRSPC